MKVKLTILFVLLSFNLIFSQVEENVFDCYIQQDSVAYNLATAQTPFIGTTNVAFLLCVEEGQNDSVSTNLLINQIKEKIPNYFEKATHGNYHVNVTDILVKSTNIQSGYSHLFVLPDSVIPNASIGPNFVVQPWMVNNVLAQADSIYDFNEFDSDDDGIVDYFVFMIIRFAEGTARGTTGLSIDSFYYTDDTLATGVHVKIDGRGYLHYSGKRAIIQRRNTTNFEKIISITVHEMGHSLFGFPDMDHSGSTYFDHYALGNFSPMTMALSNSGFRGRASLYNPYFRISKGWVTPTQISSTNSINFSDFDNTGSIYEYDIPHYPGAVSLLNLPDNSRRNL